MVDLAGTLVSLLVKQLRQDDRLRIAGGLIRATSGLADQRCRCYRAACRFGMAAVNLMPRRTVLKNVLFHGASARDRA
jgi:hypothetical protein